MADCGSAHNESDCLNSTMVYNYGRHEYNAAFAVEHALSTIAVPVLSVIVTTVGVLGNSLVIFVVASNSQMRSTTNLLIINLAIADLLFTVFCVPFKAFDFALPFWIFGEIWCKIIWFLIVISAYASIYTLVLMTADRYLALVHPVSSRSYRTTKNAYKAIFYMWVVILLSCTPVLPSHGVVRYKYQQQEFSECVFIKDTYSYVTFKVCFFVTSYFVPLLLIFYFYRRILKNVFRGGTDEFSVMNSASKKRITKMVIIVVVVFAVCWFPTQIVLLLKSLGVYTTSPTTISIEIFSYIGAYANSCVNPFLYAFYSENFRKGFKKTLSFVPKIHSIRSYES